MKIPLPWFNTLKQSKPTNESFIHPRTSGNLTFQHDQGNPQQRQAFWITIKTQETHQQHQQLQRDYSSWTRKRHSHTHQNKQWFKIMDCMILQLWLSTIIEEGWRLLTTLMNKAIKRSKPFADIIKQFCVILQIQEDMRGIIKTYQQINKETETSKNISWKCSQDTLTSEHLLMRNKQ